MYLVFAVGLGSFLGGATRYLISLSAQEKFASMFPIGTLTVNMLGSLLIGVVYALADKGQLSQEWRLFLATGVLGGFTTFSAFSLETINLIRDEQLFYAAAYISTSIVGGLIAAYIGLIAVKFF